MSAPIEGLTHNSAYEFRLVGINAAARVSLPSGAETFTTLTVPAPSATADPALDPGATSAHLSGRVNPQRAPTTIRFEYSSDGGSSWQSLGAQDSSTVPGLADSTSEVELEDDVSGLEPNSEFQFRIVASNAGGEVTSNEIGFKTDAQAPQVQDPWRQPDHHHGKPGGEGQSAQLRDNLLLRSGKPGRFLGRNQPRLRGRGRRRRLLSVSQQASGLDPETSYLYRLVAKNRAGASAGEPRVLTTQTAQGSPGSDTCPNAAIRAQQYSAFLPECRAYEMVSPLEKGADVANGGIARAAEGGGAVTYISFGSLAPGVSASISTSSTAPGPRTAGPLFR